MSILSDPREMESLQTDLTRWTIGPFHGSLPGPMKMILTLDGEVIVQAEVEMGFLHRGLEKSFELHAWQSAVMYADHLDPESAVFGELALCLAVEGIAGIEVPKRAQYIRIVLSELNRISSHLGYLAKVARAAGAETMMHYVLRDREKVLDLFELLTGARFSFNFLRFGGVSGDVTEGFIERVLEFCDLIRVRTKEYNDLFSFNQAFMKRAANVGIISPEAAFTFGVTGPNARASGIDYDVRRSHAYSSYEQVDFEVPLGKGIAGALGDSHDRYLMRLSEITQSIEILRHVLETLPEPASDGADRPKVDRQFVVPPGEAYARVEGPRGLLGCYVASDGGPRPARVQFSPPSRALIHALPDLVRGSRVEDLPILLASLDISIAEVDR